MRRPRGLRNVSFAVLAAVFVAANLLHAAPAATPELTAQAVITGVWQHLGGREAYENARYLRFTWVVERKGEIVVSRRHIWDRFTGDYVVAMRDRSTGDTLTAYLSVDTRGGVAVKNGEVLVGDAAREMLENAYGAFINDTYWLLVPAKLEDPGVRATVVERRGGAAGDTTVLHLAFENVGLTPGDQYWLYVLDSGQIVKWRYRLESGREGDFDWTEERDCGAGLTFATKKINRSNGVAIVFPEVSFSEEIDRAVFEYEADR